MSYENWASIDVDMGADLAAIARAAGSACAEGTIIWSEGRGYVADVGQAALDAALASFNPTAARKASLIAYAADRRFMIETGGIEVMGATVATDRASQGMIGRAYTLALVDPDEPVDYKAQSGWVEVDSATMIEIAKAVGRHVRACFRAEKQVCDQIEAGTITTTEEIDAAFSA